MQKREVIMLLAYLQPLYKNFQATDATIEVWAIALADTDASLALTAAKFISQTITEKQRDLPPAPSDIFRAIGDISPRDRKPHVDKSGMGEDYQRNGRWYWRAKGENWIGIYEARLKNGYVPILDTPGKALIFRPIEECTRLKGEISIQGTKLPRWGWTASEFSDAPLTQDFIQLYYNNMDPKKRELLGIQKNSEGYWECTGSSLPKFKVKAPKPNQGAKIPGWSSVGEVMAENPNLARFLDV